jgi:DNA-directed RNA polymerase subunit RPC12/RpoP
VTQPMDWEPQSNTLYQCLNCDALFARPEAVLIYGDWIYGCPECYSVEMFEIPQQAVWGIFWHIVAHEFSEVERTNLRMISEAQMGPFNPISRDL